MKKKSTSLRRWFLLFLAVLFAYGFVRYKKYGHILDQSMLSGKLENRIDEVLTRFEVRDRDVVENSRVLKTQNIPVPVSWIETTRKIAVPDRKKIQSIKTEVLKTATAMKFKVMRVIDDPHRTFLEIGRGNRAFQKLTFVASK